MSKIKYAVRSVIGFFKLAILFMFHNNISFAFTDTIASGATVKTENGGKIKLGKIVQIRNNVEISANGGSIELFGNNYINRNTIISSHKSIKIGNGTTIGPNVVIYDHDHGKNGNDYICEPVIIGENVWIGSGCIILKGVTIGDNAVVGAGTLVSKNVENNRTVINKRLLIEVYSGGQV